MRVLRRQARSNQPSKPSFILEWFELGSFFRSCRSAEIGDKASCLGVTLLSGGDLH
ncbi:hypothetical protein GU254_13885 [Vibrio cholerae]|nr:hypothetical protein [Vibrio cholerae]EMP90995.1 hypothetical protein VC87395_003147 [Vibrio paracholerae 87395]MBN7279830.1 hypothetical protein [Vibrio paracholerae]MBN7283191.1 hypothetical protein [Vibrio paracholerae]MBN7285305.1 hypothetical protein [Vibrio paracholerae]